MTPKRPKAERKDPPAIKPDAIYTVAETAVLLNYNRATIDRWRKEGQLTRNGERVYLPFIKGEKAGSEVRLRGRSILEFLEKLEQEGPDGKDEG